MPARDGRQGRDASGLASASPLASSEPHAGLGPGSTSDLTTDAPFVVPRTSRRMTPTIPTQGQEIALLVPLTASSSAVFCTIVIHALVLMAAVNFVRRERRLARAGVNFW